MSKKVLIIEHVWCLECNHFFMAEKSDQYECPNCNKMISFERENMRYIVNK